MAASLACVLVYVHACAHTSLSFSPSIRFLWSLLRRPLLRLHHPLPSYLSLFAPSALDPEPLRTSAGGGTVRLAMSFIPGGTLDKWLYGISDEVSGKHLMIPHSRKRWGGKSWKEWSCRALHQARKTSTKTNIWIRIASGEVGVFHVKVWESKSLVCGSQKAWYVPRSPGKTTFWREKPGICPDIPGNPKSLRTKSLCSSFGPCTVPIFQSPGRPHTIGTSRIAQHNFVLGKVAGTCDFGVSSIRQARILGRT